MIQVYGRDIVKGDCFEIFGALHQVTSAVLSPQASNIVVLTFEDGTKYNLRLDQYLMKAEVSDFIKVVDADHPTVHPDSREQYESMVSHASYLWDEDERNDEYERGQVELITYSVAWTPQEADSDVCKEIVRAEILQEVLKWNAARLERLKA